MAYALSFAPEFFYGDGSVRPGELPANQLPTSVCQALRSMPPKDRDLLAREVFGVQPKHLAIETMLARVIETDTCHHLDPPVEVWIDSEGFHTVLVY